MEETLRQLGGLLLGSIPTIVLFLILFASYRSLVHKPLETVLCERRARTEGAMEKARADIAAAEARTAEYERSLREAQVAIFKAQEAKRQKAIQARAAAVVLQRTHAEDQVKQAKATLAREVEDSKRSLQGEAERLASEIVNAVLRRAEAVQHPAGGVQ